MPFTDFTIYPNGDVGLCCSDALEKTKYGNVRNQENIYMNGFEIKYSYPCCIFQ